MGAVVENLLKNQLNRVQDRIKHLDKNIENAEDEIVEWKDELDRLGQQELELEAAIHIFGENSDN
jgi:prefoldin subunit 5